MGNRLPPSVPTAANKTIKLPSLEDAVPADSSAVPEDVVNGDPQDARNFANDLRVFNQTNPDIAQTDCPSSS